jgi:molybdopterin converting factor small subunit
MTIRVHTSALLRDYSGSASELTLEAENVRAALLALELCEPKLGRSVCDETGALRRHVNLYVNGTHIRTLQGLDTPLRPGDELMFIQAVSGG